MERYLPTGNEMISLPKLNEQTAAIEDLTFLSMQQRGMIELCGTENVPRSSTAATCSSPISSSAEQKTSR